QPVQRLPRVLAANQRPVRVDERLLRDVLGVRVSRRERARIPVDVTCVPPVERLQLLVAALVDCGHGGTGPCEGRGLNPFWRFLTTGPATSPPPGRKVSDQ